MRLDVRSLEWVVISTRLLQFFLKVLRLCGVESFTARSGPGFPFLCHVADFAGEVPFYNREHSRTEIEHLARWCAPA